MGLVMGKVTPFRPDEPKRQQRLHSSLAFIRSGRLSPCVSK
jgi:hypothetical protein